jgi:hypothetical protein
VALKGVDTLGLPMDGPTANDWQKARGLGWKLQKWL